MNGLISKSHIIILVSAMLLLGTCICDLHPNAYAGFTYPNAQKAAEALANYFNLANQTHGDRDLFKIKLPVSKKDEIKVSLSESEDFEKTGGYEVKVTLFNSRAKVEELERLDTPIKFKIRPVDSANRAAGYVIELDQSDKAKRKMSEGSYANYYDVEDINQFLENFHSEFMSQLSGSYRRGSDCSQQATGPEVMERSSWSIRRFLGLSSKEVELKSTEPKFNDKFQGRLINLFKKDGPLLNSQKGPNEDDLNEFVWRLSNSLVNAGISFERFNAVYTYLSARNSPNVIYKDLNELANFSGTYSEYESFRNHDSNLNSYFNRRITKSVIEQYIDQSLKHPQGTALAQYIVKIESKIKAQSDATTNATTNATK